MNSSLLSEQVGCEEAGPSGPDEQRSVQEAEDEAAHTGDDGKAKDSDEKEKEENNMDVKNAEEEIFSSESTLEEATETRLPHKQENTSTKWWASTLDCWCI